MMLASYVIAGVAVGLLLIVVLVWRKRRNQGKATEPNYYTFFKMGVVWLPLGVICTIVFHFMDISFVIGIPITAMGAVYLAIGLTNRDKWYKPD